MRGDFIELEPIGILVNQHIRVHAGAENRGLFGYCGRERHSRAFLASAAARELVGASEVASIRRIAARKLVGASEVTAIRPQKVVVARKVAVAAGKVVRRFLAGIERGGSADVFRVALGVITQKSGVAAGVLGLFRLAVDVVTEKSGLAVDRRFVAACVAAEAPTVIAVIVAVIVRLRGLLRLLGLLRWVRLSVRRGLRIRLSVAAVLRVLIRLSVSLPGVRLSLIRLLRQILIGLLRRGLSGVRLLRRHCGGRGGLVSVPLSALDELHVILVLGHFLDIAGGSALARFLFVGAVDKPEARQRYGEHARHAQSENVHAPHGRKGGASDGGDYHEQQRISRRDP